MDKIKLASATCETAVDQGWLAEFLVEALTKYKTQIEALVETGEGAVFDALVARLAGNNKILAALLQASKDQVLAASDKLTDEVLTEVINGL